MYIDQFYNTFIANKRERRVQKTGKKRLRELGILWIFVRDCVQQYGRGVFVVVREIQTFWARIKYDICDWRVEGKIWLIIFGERKNVETEKLNTSQAGS